MTVLLCIGVQQRPVSGGDVSKGGGAQEQAAFVQTEENRLGEVLINKGIHEEHIIMAVAGDGQRWPTEGEQGSGKGFPRVFDPTRGTRWP